MYSHASIKFIEIRKILKDAKYSTVSVSICLITIIEYIIAAR